MCSAAEVILVNTSDRTSILTSSATGTLVVVYNRKVVYNLNCTVRAGLLAFAAGNTAVLAELADNSTLVVIVAKNNNTGCISYNVEEPIGTFLYTKTAADALLRINSCNTGLGD